MYSAWEEGRQLVEWMREYNASHGNVLQYFGTDIGGFYQNWKFPFENIFKYLKLVDVEYYEILNKKLEPFIELLAINARMNYSEKQGGRRASRQTHTLQGAANTYLLGRPAGRPCAAAAAA